MKPGSLTRGALLLAALVVAICSAPARAETAAPRPAQIDRNGVLILIRTALIALDQANKTGNYTVIRELGAPGFQANSAEHLAEIFAKQRIDHVDLAGVVVIEPQLTLLPQIEASGLMHLAGFFPSVPQQVSFELAFAPVNGEWRLFGISVSIGSSTPAAPSPPPAPGPSAANPLPNARPASRTASQAAPSPPAAKPR